MEGLGKFTILFPKRDYELDDVKKTILYLPCYLIDRVGSVVDDLIYIVLESVLNKLFYYIKKPVDKFGRMSDAKTRDTGVSLTYINNNYIGSDGSTPVSGSINMNGNTLYNVPDPVNPQDVVTKEYADTTNKAFVLLEGKYLAVGDLSMGGRRLNNVGMPIENHQASNKFYVDTAVKTATAGDKALRKIQDGIFVTTGDIDMNGNSITGLPNPIDRDAAANKNYVDSGGAITKLPNGAFTTVSDIDFDGFSLKNIPDPIDGKDAVNKAYVDDRTIQPAAPIKPIITVWAEEKGPLGNGHYEFSFGNGSSGSEHAYGVYCMSAPGRIIRGSLTATESRNILSEELKVNIVVKEKNRLITPSLKNPEIFVAAQFSTIRSN